MDRWTNSATKLTTPWECWIVEHFLSREELCEVEQIIKSGSVRYSQQPDDEWCIRFAEFPSSSACDTMMSDDFVALLEKLSGIDGLVINSENALQIRVMDMASPPMTRHADSETYGTTVVSILYLSKGWRLDYGGRLLLHHSTSSADESAVVVEPIENRLVVFRDDPSHVHEVEPVRGTWSRFTAIAEWNAVSNTDIRQGS